MQQQDTNNVERNGKVIITQHKSETEISMEVINCKGDVYRKRCASAGATQQEG